MFVNLHLHTTYSLLDSVSKPEDVIRKIKVMNHPAVAVTEHGNLYSSVKMFKLCEQNDIKYIYGCEFYTTDNRLIKDKNNKYYHLTVLAANEIGRINLNKLVSISYLEESFFYKPRIDFETLSEHSEGLIVLSGCMAGELQRALAGGKIGDNDVIITRDNILKAKEVAQRYCSVFGNSYYLEVQSHSDPRQQQLNRAIVDIAKELKIKWVNTADSHFINEEDQELHEIFVQIGQAREVGEIYKDTQVQSEDDVRRLLKPGLTDDEIDVALKTTEEIVDKCNVKLPLSAPIIPHVKIPKQFDSEDDYLKYLCNQGWKKRGFHKLNQDEQKIYKDRLYYEFDAVSKMGFSGYYLLVYSYANSVRKRGIARGSGGGSLIAYLLNIIDIDPVVHGLYFERFIDVGALDLLAQGVITPKELKIPDVDLDFGQSDRKKVMQFIIDEYGEDKVAALGSFMYIWDKSAIKDIGRVLGVPFNITNEITKKMDKGTDLENMVTDKMFKRYVEQYPKLFDYAKRITGLPRSASVHPSGKVIAMKDLNYYTGTSYVDRESVLQLDMDDAGDLGLVKIDALGLKTVDVIYDTLDLIGKDYDYINPKKLDFHDEKLLDLFRQGNTFSVFQFESQGMKNTLRHIIPSGLDDLAVANALFRPGSMNFISNYIERKHGRERFEYLHPDLEPILKSTYGIIVFQEQLIEIGRLAGMRNPDEIRKATAKKDIKKMEKVKPELITGLKKRGWTEEQVDVLWDIIIEFARYSFNKSHSYSYAIIAFITAKLRVYHPIEYFTALLNVEINKSERIAEALSECIKSNINITVPDINLSDKKFTIHNNSILYGFQGIKGVGGTAADAIIKERDKGKFKSLEDFYNRIDKSVVNTSTIVSLIKGGCFNFNNKDKILLLKRFAKLIFEYRPFKPVKNVPQKKDLFNANLIKTDDEFKDKNKCLQLWNEHKELLHEQKQQEKLERHLNEFSEKYITDKDMYEFETLSMFLNENPFEDVKDHFKDFDSVNDHEKMLVGGVITSVEYKKQRNKERMAILGLLTQYGVIECSIYSQSLSLYQDLIKKSSNIVALAKKSGTQFVLDKIKSLSKWKEEKGL